MSLPINRLHWYKFLGFLAIYSEHSLSESLVCPAH